MLTATTDRKRPPPILSEESAASAPLTADTTLELADGLSLVWAKGALHMSVGPRRLRGDRYTLAILDVFSRPRSVKAGLDELEERIRGAPAWVEVIARIKALHNVGFLVQPGGEGVLRRAHEKRFDSAPVHITMLNDERRTSAFQAAIRRTVRSGDVVLDIGTGTGVLAVTAAKVGARHVYAVEATPMSNAARRLAEANGVAERVTVIEAHSFDVDLPERAQVLVSEIIGDDPLGEQILPTFVDARRRLLAEGARVIPSSLDIFALPVEVPVERMRAFRFTLAQTEVWSERYGLNFDSLAVTSAENDHLTHVNSYESRDWERLSEPVLLAKVDLVRPQERPMDRKMILRPTATGDISGALVYFTADLAPGIRLSLHPDDAAPSNSWGNILYLFAAPIHVIRDEEVGLRYQYDGRGSRLALVPAPRRRPDGSG